MTDDELERLLDANAAENRRYFDETADRFAAENRHHFEVATEATKHNIGLVAEKVTSIDEKLSRETAAIREEMRRGFRDTQAMIKFSHDELQRRVQTLEENQRSVEQTLADMQARLERLEGSTH